MKNAKYIITTKGRTIDEQLKSGEVYCLQHARFVFKDDCQMYGRNVATRMWKVMEFATNQDHKVLD